MTGLFLFFIIPLDSLIWLVRSDSFFFILISNTLLPTQNLITSIVDTTHNQCPIIKKESLKQFIVYKKKKEKKRCPVCHGFVMLQYIFRYVRKRSWSILFSVLGKGFVLYLKKKTFKREKIGTCSIKVTLKVPAVPSLAFSKGRDVWQYVGPSLQRSFAGRCFNQPHPCGYMRFFLNWPNVTVMTAWR